MKITQSKVKNMMATLIVEINEADYIGKVDSALKKYRKDAVIPGFRKGKTPMSIISKQYRTSTVVDEVNKMMQDNLYKLEFLEVHCLFQIVKLIGLMKLILNLNMKLV
jgi:trigger factor